MDADIKLLRDALTSYQLCASAEPHMGGGYTITGWTPTKLSKAYKKASEALLATK